MSNLKNVSSFAKQNNNSFSDYNNLNSFRDKLTFTKIDRNKNIIKNIKQSGGMPSFGNLSKMVDKAGEIADDAGKIVDKADQVSSKGTAVLSHAQNVAGQVTHTVGDVASQVTQQVNDVSNVVGNIPTPEIVHPNSQLPPPPQVPQIPINPNQQPQIPQPPQKQIPVDQTQPQQSQQLQELQEPTNKEDPDDDDNDDNNNDDDDDNDEEEIPVEYTTSDGTVIDNNVTNNNGNDIIVNINNTSTECKIVEGSTLYFATKDISLDPSRDGPFSLEKKGVSMLTPNHSVARAYLKNCGIEYQSGAIHMFTVKNTIPSIYKHSTGLPLDSSKEFLNDNFCSKDSKYNGVKFSYPVDPITEAVHKVTNSNGTSSISTTVDMNDQYWMCQSFDCNYYLEYQYTEKCKGLGLLKKVDQ